jgi:hypothetical protein
LTASRGGFQHPAEILFSARAQINGLNWSPDDHWLLASSPSGDQWIFIRARPPVRLEAVSRIRAQFLTPPGGARARRLRGTRTTLATPGANGFPTLGGWQSPPSPQPSG